MVAKGNLIKQKTFDLVKVFATFIIFLYQNDHTAINKTSVRILSRMIILALLDRQRLTACFASHLALKSINPYYGMEPR